MVKPSPARSVRHDFRAFGMKSAQVVTCALPGLERGRGSDSVAVGRRGLFVVGHRDVDAHGMRHREIDFRFRRETGKSEGGQVGNDGGVGGGSGNEHGVFLFNLPGLEVNRIYYEKV